jgi:hypothetical protein
MNLNPVNPYAAAAEKAMAAQRAAGGRKKAVKSVRAAECASTPEEALMISSWMNAGQRRVGKR